jgi:hypothetical protein
MPLRPIERVTAAVNQLPSQSPCSSTHQLPDALTSLLACRAEIAAPDAAAAKAAEAAAVQAAAEANAPLVNGMTLDERFQLCRSIGEECISGGRKGDREGGRQRTKNTTFVSKVAKAGAIRKGSNGINSPVLQLCSSTGERLHLR